MRLFFVELTTRRPYAIGTGRAMRLNAGDGPFHDGPVVRKVVLSPGARLCRSFFSRTQHALNGFRRAPRRVPARCGERHGSGFCCMPARARLYLFASSSVVSDASSGWPGLWSGPSSKKKAGCVPPKHPVGQFQKKPKRNQRRIFGMVPRRGLEPPRLSALVPETSASTNSATWALPG